MIAGLGVVLMTVGAMWLQKKVNIDQKQTPELVISNNKPRLEVTYYTVQKGDRLETIAQKFGLKVETIMKANGGDKINEGQKLLILPIDGQLYITQSSETVKSIAQKAQMDPQKILDFPGNEVADETTTLATGTSLIIPE